MNFGIIIRYESQIIYYEYSSTTQKGAAGSSEITVQIYQTTWRHIP